MIDLGCTQGTGALVSLRIVIEKGQRRGIAWHWKYRKYRFLGRFTLHQVHVVARW